MLLDLGREVHGSPAVSGLGLNQDLLDEMDACRQSRHQPEHVVEVKPLVVVAIQGNWGRAVIRPLD